MIRHSSCEITQKDFNYLNEIIQNNYISYGKFSKELVNFSAQYSQRKYAILCDSGTDALQLILKHLKLKHPAQNTIFISSYACPSLVSAILQEGLKPVYLEVASNRMNITLESFKYVDLKGALAIVCTHIGGYQDDLAQLSTLNIPLISDCAQALGSELNGKSLLSFGQYGLTSFGPTKYITGGQGGALFCDDSQDYESLLMLASSELSVEYYQKNGVKESIGQHSNDLVSGLVLAQWKRISEIKNKRRKVAKAYDQVLLNKEGIEILKESDGENWNRFRYYFFSEKSEEIIKKLHTAGIDARSSISHDLASYEGVIFTNVKKLSSQMISLPIYQGLQKSEIDLILKALEEL